MPRSARRSSVTGYFHLIIRGIGRQILFEEKADYLFFLSILERFSGETGVVVCAYCLMENHVHLLVFDRTQQVSRFMQKTEGSYAVYFNKKYDRCGHLFQNRYLSEPVENETYLYNTFRYILKNPQKAGICPAECYPWSSYRLYHDNESFVDTSAFRERIGDSRQLDVFMQKECSAPFMEYGSENKDERAHELICQLLHVKNGRELQTWDRKSRNKALSQLKNNGLSIRRIERLTGISRNIVQRA